MTSTRININVAVVGRDQIIKDFCQGIIESDARLGDNPETAWLRRRLFRLYYLALGIDIDEFCSHSSKEPLKGAGRRKEKGGLRR